MSSLTLKRIVLLAFTCSVVFSQIILPALPSDFHINLDPDRFGSVARNLAAGDGFVYSPGGTSVFERAPLYPFLIAPLYRLGGEQALTLIQFLQALIHSFTVLILYHIAKRFTSAQNSLRLAGLTAIHPILIWYTGRIWAETLLAFLILMIAYALILLYEIPSLKRSLVAGFAIGVATLTKSVVLLLPVLVLFFLVRLFGRRGLMQGIVVCVVSAAVVLPWTLRNYAASGELVIVHTSLGFNLMQGRVITEQWPGRGFDIMQYWNEAKRVTDSLLHDSHATWESVQGDRMLIREHSRWVAASPLSFLKGILVNFVTLWHLSEGIVKSAAVGVLQISLLAAVLYSLGKLKREDFARGMPVLLILGYLVVVQASIVGWGRYSMPAIPLMLLTLSLPKSGETQGAP